MKSEDTDIRNINVNTGNLSININMGRVNSGIIDAADALGESILVYSTKFVPKREGVLRNSGHVEQQGSGGEVVWDAPYAHYQNEGILYVGEESGSSFAGLGEKKIPAEPEKALTYSTTGTGSHWFDKAKKQYGQDMIREAVSKINDGR